MSSTEHENPQSTDREGVQGVSPEVIDEYLYDHRLVEAAVRADRPDRPIFMVESLGAEYDQLVAEGNTPAVTREEFIERFASDEHAK